MQNILSYWVLTNSILYTSNMGFVTREVAALLIRNNPRLRVLHCAGSIITHLTMRIEAVTELILVLLFEILWVKFLFFFCKVYVIVDFELNLESYPRFSYVFCHSCFETFHTALFSFFFL